MTITPQSPEEIDRLAALEQKLTKQAEIIKVMEEAFGYYSSKEMSPESPWQFLGRFIFLKISAKDARNVVLNGKLYYIGGKHAEEALSKVAELRSGE